MPIKIQTYSASYQQHFIEMLFKYFNNDLHIKLDQEQIENDSVKYLV